MFLDDMRISRKLTLSFAAITLTMAGMGGAVLLSLRTLDAAKVEIAQSQDVLSALDEAKFYMTRQENSYRGYLLSKDDYYLQRVDKHRGNFQARLKIARDGLADAKLAAQIDAAGVAADQWYSKVFQAGVRLAADPGTLPQAIAMVGPDGQADAVITPAEDAIEAVRDAMAAKMTTLKARQTQASRTVDTALAIGLGLAVLIAIGLGMLLTRTIAAPVNAMTAAMRRLAQGDFSATVPATGRKDEVGQMAEAVAVFKEAGLEKRRLEGQAAEQRSAADQERARHEAATASTAEEQAQVVAGLAEGLGRLSQGDLTYRIAAVFPAQYRELRDTFNTAIDQLQEAMSVVIANVRGITNNAGEISTAADDLSRRTEQQAASLEETAAALDEITMTVNRTAHGAKTCAEVVLAARGDAQASGEVVNQAVTAMSGIEHSAKQISQIIGVIDEIAFQTNLLALNAGVEAARAGDAGKGFAVVASEVRALAQRSAEAAKEIKTLISTSTRQVDKGVQLVGETGDALRRIAGRVAQIDDLVAEISAAAQEQATGLAEINGAVSQMDQITQQNAAMVEQSTAASHTLARDAKTLTGSVTRFAVGQAPAPAPRASIPAPAVVQAAEPARPGHRGARALRRTSHDGAALRAAAPESKGWEEF